MQMPVPPRSWPASLLLRTVKWTKLWNFLPEQQHWNQRNYTPEQAKHFIWGIFFILLWFLLITIPRQQSQSISVVHKVNLSVLWIRKRRSLAVLTRIFATPNGLDAGYTHYTTASDLAKIARYAIKKPAFRKIISTKSYSFRSLNTNRRFTVSTTNALLGNMPGVIGMKTGYTNKAGHCFVGLCQSQKGNTYISVVLGGPNSNVRWRDSRILLNYAYKHWKIKTQDRTFSQYQIKDTDWKSDFVFGRNKKTNFIRKNLYLPEKTPCL